MTNDQYLVVSYFVAGACSLVIGLCAFLWLRAPVRSFCAALPWEGLRRLLAKIFPAGVVLPALLGFLSVSYFGCDKDSYEKIVATRDYLEQKNLDQISASFAYVFYAVCVWSLILAIALWAKKRMGTSSEATREGTN